MDTISTYLVVKLGGSLMRSPHLGQWLDMLAVQGGGRVVIVPGGGAFADRVRTAQRRFEFDDRSAHRLALLAMVQYGHLLLALRPDLQPAPGMDAVRAALRSGRVPVWLPLALLNDTSEIPASWDWSGDSIALWLSGRMDAELCLVKSMTPEKDGYTVAELQRAGVIDRAFPDLLRRQSGKAYWLGPAQHGDFGHALVHDRPGFDRSKHLKPVFAF